MLLKVLIRLRNLFIGKKKKSTLKPMGIRSTVYPEGYIPPIKRILSDGTIEYYIPIQAQKELQNAWKKLGKETIKGSSIKEIICSDGGDEVESIVYYV